MAIRPDALDVLHEPDPGARFDAVTEAVVGVARGAVLTVEAGAPIGHSSIDRKRIGGRRQLPDPRTNPPERRVIDGHGRDAGAQ